MAEFERIGELEAAMIPGKDGTVNPLLIMASLAALGKEDRAIITGGKLDDHGIALALQEDCFLAYTSEQELQTAGLEGHMIPIRDLLRFAAKHSDDIDGIILNPESQRLLLSQELIAEILDLMGDEEEPEEEEPEASDTRPDTVFTADSPGWEWLPAGIAVGAAEGTVLSDEAREVFAHFHHYSDGIRSFVLLSDHVGSFYDAVPGPIRTPKECMALLTEEAEDSMAESLGYHPDFSKYTMDDGMLAVRLFSGVWCFRSPGDFEDPTDETMEPSFPVAMAMREELLRACGRGRILLIAMPLGE